MIGKIAYMLVTFTHCCGADVGLPAAGAPVPIVSGTPLNGLTEKDCYARGVTWVQSGTARGFLCLKRQY